MVNQALQIPDEAAYTWSEDGNPDLRSLSCENPSLINSGDGIESGDVFPVTPGPVRTNPNAPTIPGTGSTNKKDEGDGGGSSTVIGDEKNEEEEEEEEGDSNTVDGTEDIEEGEEVEVGIPDDHSEDTSLIDQPVNVIDERGGTSETYPVSGIDATLSLPPNVIEKAGISLYTILISVGVICFLMAIFGIRIYTNNDIAGGGGDLVGKRSQKSGKDQWNKTNHTPGQGLDNFKVPAQHSLVTSEIKNISNVNAKQLIGNGNILNEIAVSFEAMRQGGYLNAFDDNEECCDLWDDENCKLLGESKQNQLNYGSRSGILSEDVETALKSQPR